MRRLLNALGAEPAVLSTVARRVAEGDLSQAHTGSVPAGSVMVSMQQMQPGLVKLIGAVRQNAERVAAASAQISTGSHDLSSRTETQASGIRQINEAVGMLDQGTQQNAAMVEESAAAAESLRRQAAEMQALVATFRLATFRLAA